MAQARFKDTVIAESDSTVMIEGNHYFPPESVNFDYLSDSDEQYTCPWKGEAKYYNVTVDGQTSEAAAWCYPKLNDGALQDPRANAADGTDFSGYLAFWKEVEVLD